jgi:addiction module HigA family antidote
MKNPSHPGTILRNLYLEGTNLSVTQAAAGLGVARPTLSKLLNGRASVSPEMAVRLSKAFGNGAAFWLRLQLNYDVGQIEKEAAHIKVKKFVTSSEAWA